MAVLEKAVGMVIGNQQELADAWNRKHPSDQPVPVLIDLGGEQRVRGRTIGSAVMINGYAYITVRHIKEAVRLDRVNERFCVYVRIKRRGQVPHWQHTTWDDRDAFESAMQQARDSDPRIESVETSNLRPADFTP